MGDLIRSDTVIGTPHVIVGSKDKDFVIQTKGKVKIQEGNRFIDLLIDGKLNIPSIINIVSTVSKIPKRTGLYWTKDTQTLYYVIDNKQFELTGTSNNTTTTIGATRLDELEDVSLVNLRNGDILVEKGGYWVNTHLNLEDVTKQLKTQLDSLSESVEAQRLYTQRSFTDVMQTFNMMFDPEGSYFTDKITPLAIQTAQLIVGTNSQQFDLENIKFEPNYQGDCNRFVANCIDRTKPGLLIHHTIGLADGTGSRTWEILQPSGPPDFDKSGLSASTPYYIYAVCSRTGTTGSLLVSDQQILVESDSANYTFWIGVLNTPTASMTEGDGVSSATATASLVRSFQTTFGFTEIAGNSITTGVIKDQAGFSYWDMINGALRLGGTNSYIYYNSADGNFYLKGRLIQVDPDLNTSLNYVGDFVENDTKLYKKGDIVTYKGSYHQQNYWR